MLYDYQSYLNLDSESYEAWQPHLALLESLAINQAQLINDKIQISADNELLKSYCNEFVFMQEYGDELSASLYKFHSDMLANWEEAIRYAG